MKAIGDFIRTFFIVSLIQIGIRILIFLALIIVAILVINGMIEEDGIRKALLFIIFCAVVYGITS